jgi:putative spermidine/putrescine transport system ATP-binding protein
MNVRIEAQGLRKTYGSVTAVHGFSYRFAPGKITAILGPSGSGKSTTLSMLTGLTEPDAGRIMLDDTDITALPAEKRGFGLVFQNYSLFPHMSVAENVEFGLRVRGVGKKERQAKAAEALERVHIGRLAQRRIHQISGGEQQRVALARALAFNPGVLLLDEPLSALDAKLREALRTELGRLLNELSITTIYVTHDQVEAMSLGHELIIMKDGKIEQAGTPAEVYGKPATRFVATFLGSANILEGECVHVGGESRVRLPFADLSVTEGIAAGPCRVMIRPEDLVIVPADEAQMFGTIASSVFLGSQTRLALSVGNHDLIMEVHGGPVPAPGASVPLRIRENKLCIMAYGE